MFLMECQGRSWLTGQNLGHTAEPSDLFAARTLFPNQDIHHPFVGEFFLSARFVQVSAVRAPPT